jgi:hypothetical protein
LFTWWHIVSTNYKVRTNAKYKTHKFKETNKNMTNVKIQVKKKRQ